MQQLQIAASQPSTMYGIYGYSIVYGGGYKWFMLSSSDAGVNWNSYKYPLRDTVTTQQYQSNNLLTFPYIFKHRELRVSPVAEREVYIHKFYHYDLIGQITEYEQLYRSVSGADSNTFQLVTSWNIPKGLVSQCKRIEISPFSGDTIIIVTAKVCGVSTDRGSTWNIVRIDSAGTQSSDVIDWLQRILYISSSASTISITPNIGVRKSTDFGVTWSEMNKGFYFPKVNDIHLDAFGNLYAATLDGVYQWNATVDVQPEQHVMPTTVYLSQNYPNPFSDQTTIHFTIPSRSFVRMEIYDLLGRQIRTLTNGDFNGGTHTISSALNGPTNGMYLYKLSVRDQQHQVQTLIRKMIVQRNAE